MTARGRARQVPARELRPGDWLVLKIVDVKPTPARMGDLWFVCKLDARSESDVYLSFEAEDVVDIERPA